MQWELTSLAVYGAMDCCVILGKLMMMISATAFSTAFFALFRVVAFSYAGETSSVTFQD